MTSTETTETSTEAGAGVEPAGEPFTVDAPPEPTFAHVVELLEQDGSRAAVYAIDTNGRRAGGYWPDDSVPTAMRWEHARTWQHLLGVAWARHLAVRVCPLGFARHAAFGAVRCRPLYRDSGDAHPYGEEVVIAGPPVGSGMGDPAKQDPRRWVSLTSPGGRYTDDEVDRPPWVSVDRASALGRLIPQDPA